MWSGFLHSQLVFDSFCSQLLSVLPLYLSIASLSRNELRKVCPLVLLLRLLFISPPPLFSDHVLSSAQLGYALELPATPTCQLLRISPENIAISAIQKRLLRISGECQLYNSSFLRLGQKELLQQFVAKLPCRFQH